MSSITLNTSVKAHLLLGGFIALWLVLFQILIAPFDVADLTLKNRLILIPPYGLILVACYAVIIGVQNWWFSLDKKWTVLRESICIVLLYILLLPSCWVYYSTDLINGTYPFSEFALFIFLPIAFIFSAFIIMGRMYLNKLQKKKDAQRVALKGNSESELLQLSPEQFVTISSAQNYVEVYYLLGDKLEKELLRMPLKRAAENTPHLIQVHRSHLVNPLHFVKWIDPNTAQINQLQIPISQTYKAAFKSQL